MTAVPAMSIVIPCLNEARRLPRCLEEIRLYLERRGDTAEVIVVDDGSRDGTSVVASALRESFPWLRVLTLERNRGKGAAVRAGVLASRGAVVAFTDADLSVPIGTLDLLLERLTTHDFAITSRAAPQARVVVGQGRLREGLAHGFDLLRRLLVVRGIRDTQCGMKAYRRDAARVLFENLGCDSALFDIEVFVRAALHGFTLAELPAVWTHDPDSRIRYGPIRSVKTFLELLAIKWRYRIVWPLIVRSTFVSSLLEAPEPGYRIRPRA